MALSNATKKKIQRQKKADAGLRKLPDKYVNADNFDLYNLEVDKKIAQLNKRLNCTKLGG